MDKVFIIRHQAHGYLTQFLFAHSPTGTQMSAARRLCERLHGDKHPKTKAEYWMRVEEIPVLDADAVLPAAEPPGSTSNVAALRPMTVTGEMHVSPPKEGS